MNIFKGLFDKKQQQIDKTNEVLKNTEKEEKANEKTATDIDAKFNSL